MAQKPGAAAPYCIVGFYDTAGEVLLKREPTGSPGVRGNPGGVFASFCRYELKLGQKEVAAQSITFWVGLRSLCADIPQQKSGLRATFFLHTKKEGKDVPRGFPPLEPRVVLSIFSL